MISTKMSKILAVWSFYQFTFILTVIQVIFLIIFALFSAYKFEATSVQQDSHKQILYSDFQDIHITLIVGFGFLVAFLRRYGFASFGISLLLIAFTIQWALILRGFSSPDFAQTGKFYLTLQSFVQADFSAATVLISFGALIGKLSPVQYLILAFIETPISLISEFIVLYKLQVQDVGGAVVIHVFGAIFGIFASRFLFNLKWQKSEDNESVYHSEIISFVGAAFLWIFCPSFNAVNVIQSIRYRAIINTYLALLGSTITAFLVSQLNSKTHHFNIRHIVCASLAGGVALGASANIILAPFHAILIGIIAGIISILGFQIVSPLINFKFGIHDTRSVLSIHGLPGIFGSIASAILLFIYPSEVFSASLKIIAHERNNYSQAIFQLIGLGVSIGMAVVFGAITGFILNLKIWNVVKENELFCDADYFKVPEDYEFTTKISSHIERVELSEASSSERTKPDITTVQNVVP